MPVLPILKYPDSRLHTIARAVTRFDGELNSLVRDLARTMYHASGIGLAATQVDVHRRVLVVDVSESRDQLMVIVNPVLVEGVGESELDEGCLSVPGIYERVSRFDQVVIRAQDANGDSRDIAAGGLLSVCLQHEMDHLEGRVFVEYLSRLKQTRIAAKLGKQSRRPR